MKKTTAMFKHSDPVRRRRPSARWCVCLGLVVILSWCAAPAIDALMPRRCHRGSASAVASARHSGGLVAPSRAPAGDRTPRIGNQPSARGVEEVWPGDSSCLRSICLSATPHAAPVPGRAELSAGVRLGSEPVRFKSFVVPANYRPAAFGSREVRLCQALGPAAPCPVGAVDCSSCPPGRWRYGWECARARNWQAFAQGEYVGHARLPHVPEYRLRVDDVLELVYRRTREKTATPYKLNVGDQIRVESFTDPDLNRDLIIQPDGTITLRLLGQVEATDLTVDQLRAKLEELYKQYYKVPAITVTPLLVNSKLNDLVSSVDARYGQGGLVRQARVTPAGNIAVPVLGTVYVQGLTLPELQEELNERYREVIEGIEVIPVLLARAPRYVYVLGEVANPGRYELTGPTTVMQAIAMAGSWKVGSDLRQVVVFRRGDDWRLLATRLNVGPALHGNQPCPTGEIWLNDSDIVLVPKSPLLRADEFIEMTFTRGIYGVFPLQTTINFSKLSSI